MSEMIEHHGILGQKWGIRRTPAQLGNLSKKDANWVKKKSEKITEQARRKSSKEMSRYANEILRSPGAVNKSGKLSSSAINAYNKKMAELMSQSASKIRSPSGKVVQFVAKRGEIGVMMALADEGYNMAQLRNGVRASGRVANKKTELYKAKGGDEKKDIAIGSRFKHAWNAFRNNGQQHFYRDIGTGYSYRPDRPRLTRGNERSIVTSVYNRIALDAAAINIQHVRLDDNERFLEVIKSGLNNCLSLEANIDQTGRSFIQDIVMSMLDEGCVAIVPTDTDDDPEDGVAGSFDIDKMRTGKILEWYPKHVRVQVYNENTGLKEDILMPKEAVAIIENPLYAVINEPNSTMQRLIRKLNLLDVVDEQSSSGKLDLIIQLPYVIKTDARRQQAEKRRKDIEQQLSGSKYGIAYTDGTEHITQLNRSVGNNLMSQIEYLTSMLYSQLGITQSILDGTADETTMLNYYNRTIEPIVSAIVDEMKRKFLTKTARSQKQSIMFFRDPFKLVPVTELAEISDKLTRNEIATSNEMRQTIGWKPSKDPKADELRNKNLNQTEGEVNSGNPTMADEGTSTGESEQDRIVNELLDSLESEIEKIIGDYISDDEEEEEDS